MDESDWSERLRHARRIVGMTQATLAVASGLSMQTVRAYERRRRHPTRARLVAMLDALRVERGERNAIMTGAGFAADGRSMRPPEETLAFTAAEAARETERYVWPAFVTDEFATMLSANAVAQRLWCVDLAREFQDPLERNLLTVLSNPRFADPMVNWEEAISVVLSVFKGHHRGGEDLDHPSPYFRAVLDRFLAGDRDYVSRFGELWQAAPAPVVKMRWSYPVVWRTPASVLLRFHCFASAANEADGLTFHDWIPLDGATWAALPLPG